VTSSEVVHASASRPEGPFDFHGPALPRRGSEFWDGMSTHNPTVVWDAHARLYRLFYTGMRYAFAPPADGPFLNRTEYETAWNSKRVGVASASSVYGPWRREATPLLMPRPGHWDAAITSNPAAVIFSSGRTVLFYKSIASPYPQRNWLKPVFHIGAAVAPRATGPFTRVGDSPVLTWNGRALGAEDPFLWHCGDRFHLLFKTMAPIRRLRIGPAKLVYSSSRQFENWSSPLKVFSTEQVSLAPQGARNGKRITARRLERPQLLFQRDGDDGTTVGDGAPFSHAYFGVVLDNIFRNVAMRAPPPIS